MATIVVYGGGFQPFHVGHLSSYLQAKKAFPNAAFYVAASNDTKQRPIPFQDKQFLAQQAGVKDPFVEVKQPINPVEILSKYNPEQDVFIIVRSERDPMSYQKKDGSPAYYQPFVSLDKCAPFGQHGYVLVTKKHTFMVGGHEIYSGTQVRDMYTNADDKGKLELIKELYPNSNQQLTIKKMLDKYLGAQAAPQVATGDAMKKLKDKQLAEQISKIRPLLKEASPEQKLKLMKLMKSALNESRIMDRDAIINAYYVSTKGDRHKVAENIPYYLLDRLVPLLTKKYAITMNDIEVRPADKNQYRRTSQPELAENAQVARLEEELASIKREMAEGIFDRFKKKPPEPEVADPGNYPRIGSDIAQWMAATVEYHKAKYPDSVWKLFCPSYPDYLPTRVRVGTAEKTIRAHLGDYVQLRDANPEAKKLARQKFEPNHIYPNGPREDYQNKGVDEAYDHNAPFNAADFNRHMEQLRAREELRKTDPMKALVGDLIDKDNAARNVKKKPQDDDSMSTSDPRHPQYAYTQAGQHNVDEGEEDALAYATKAHAGQTRSGGDPYITHPMRVADHIRQYKQSHNLDALISAAYLHDTIEDTDTTQEVLHDLFGGLVASLVKELTSDPEQIKKMGKAQYLSHKMAAMSSYGLVIKLADRLDNVKDITTARTPEWRAKYAKETNQILDYIEKTRALSGTHNKLISLIRAKLAEIDNPPQVADEGISRRGILKGLGVAMAAGAAGKASAIAGAFPTPSHQAAMYKAAADSNKAQARADAAEKAKADAERLRKNTDQVDKEQRVNHHSLAPTNEDYLDEK